MAYALASVSAIGLLALGGQASADYQWVCGGDPVATWDALQAGSPGIWDMCGDYSEPVNFKILKDKNAWSVEWPRAFGSLSDLAPGAQLKKVFGSLGAVVELENSSEESCADSAGITINGEKVISGKEKDYESCDDQGNNCKEKDSYELNFVYNPTTNKVYGKKVISTLSARNGDWAINKANYETLKAKFKKELNRDISGLENSESDDVSFSVMGLYECHLEKAGKTFTSVSAPVVAVSAKASPSKVAPVKVETPVTPIASVATYTTDKKGYAQIKQQPLFVIAANFGFNFKKDKKALAAYFNIPNYKGTKAQNMKIKEGLLKQIIVK